MLSYAGVYLTVPTQEQQESIQEWMDSWTEFEFNDRTWPDMALEGITFAQHNWPPAQPRLGTLYWPFTAMKWAVCHLVCSGAQLELIRAFLPPISPTQKPQPALLVMSTGDAFKTVETPMFMLPPRPIHQILETNQLYLLTLVDERYHWWYADAGVFRVVNGTTWDNLYEDLATSLDIDLDWDDIDPAIYFYPDPSIGSYYQDVPILLDAVAYNVGQRIIRKLDGAVQAINNTSSLENLNANILAINNEGSIILGGSFHRANDFGYAMPSEVHNVTPIWKSAVPTVLSPLYHVEINKMVDSPQAFNAAVGFDGEKTFRDTFHSAEADAFASDAILAFQVANDYWSRIWNAFLHVTLAHPLNILPDGLNDIEWSYEIGRPSTTIKRPSWNWEPDTLLHGDGNGPFYGNSVNESWQIQPFFAQITSAPSSDAYAWKEVIPTAGGTFIDKPINQRTGTVAVNPAYEFNTSVDVPLDAIVLMWRGFQNSGSAKQEWLFIFPEGGGFNLTVTDGSTTVTNVDKIDFTSGATVSNLGGGTAGVAISGGGGSFPPNLTSTTWSQTISDGVATQVASLTLPAVNGHYLLVGNVLSATGSAPFPTYDNITLRDSTGLIIFAGQFGYHPTAAGVLSVSFIGPFNSGDVVTLWATGAGGAASTYLLNGNFQAVQV